jgi:hypothetical protein
MKLARQRAKAGRAQHDADHVWHVWINDRQRGRPSDKWEGSLYEFKDLLKFMRYGHQQIATAFEGRLRKVHRQCSRTAPEVIHENKLKCCLGVEVTHCPILLSLKETVEQQRAIVSPFDGKRPYESLDDQAMYRLMSQTCAWHIYHEACGIQDGHHFHVDTSEGHLMDISDRMYWDRLYQSLGGSDPDESEEQE